MATPKNLASTLYRAILSSAKRYGEGAQKRCLPARKEMEMFNSVMKSVQLPLPESGIMSSQIAMAAVKRAFLEHSQEPEKMTDAFAILRKLRQKETVLSLFPQTAFSECITDGCKVTAKSCYQYERVNWHFWDYTIRISNNTERPLQLFTETLRAVDENLTERNLESALISILKTLPVIEPGQHFEFTKRMMFRTKCGSLSGSYLLMDVQSGKALHAKLAPLLLTQEKTPIDEEILSAMHASLNTKGEGDEDSKHNVQPRVSARGRRLRREEMLKEKKDEGTTSEPTEHVIPDSDLKLEILRGRYRRPFSSDVSGSVHFQRPSSSNRSSSRKRSIQRATPVSSPESNPTSSAQLELEPEGTK